MLLQVQTVGFINPKTFQDLCAGRRNVPQLTQGPAVSHSQLG